MTTRKGLVNYILPVAAAGVIGLATLVGGCSSGMVDVPEARHQELLRKEEQHTQYHGQIYGEDGLSAQLETLRDSVENPETGYKKQVTDLTGAIEDPETGYKVQVAGLKGRIESLEREPPRIEKVQGIEFQYESPEARDNVYRAADLWGRMKSGDPESPKQLTDVELYGLLISTDRSRDDEKYGRRFVSNSDSELMLNTLQERYDRAVPEPLSETRNFHFPSVQNQTP